MPISFTAQQRKDITRRQLNIALENAAYTQVIANVMALQAKFLDVDNANNVFFSFFDTQARSYEGEAEAINGTISAEFSNSDIVAAASGPYNVLFFPASPPDYIFLIPKIVPNVNGYFNPTGTAASYELKAISSPATFLGASDVISLLKNGITGSGGNTTTVTGPHSSDPLTFDVNSVSGFTANELVYISDVTHSGVYQIQSVNPASGGDPAYLTVTAVFQASVKPGTGATVKDTVAGFTNTERQNMTSTTYQEILTSEGNGLVTAVTSWQTALNSQVSNLTAQNDSRVPQVTQNATALSNANSALSVVNTWLARSFTGASGKFVDSSLSPLSAEITVRESYLPTRITEISGSLGLVVDNGDGTFSGTAGTPYFERYKWLNVRVNKQSGSLTRYYSANNTVNANNTLISNNSSLQSDYAVYFLTSQLMGIDGTDIITLKDTAGFSTSDSVTVVSESQPELNLTVLNILGPQSMRLSSPVPVTYQAGQDLARVFKQL